MIEGMPASSSMAIPIGRRSHCGHSSVRKIAIPIPTGIAISIAMKEVTNGPYIGPTAPRTGRATQAQRQQKREAVFPHRRPGAHDQRQDDAAEDQEHRDRAGAGDPVESDVSEPEGTERPGAIKAPLNFDCLVDVALNGHVCHANPLLFLAPRPGRRAWRGNRRVPLVLTFVNEPAAIRYE